MAIDANSIQEILPQAHNIESPQPYDNSYFINRAVQYGEQGVQIAKNYIQQQTRVATQELANTFDAKMTDAAYGKDGYFTNSKGLNTVKDLPIMLNNVKTEAQNIAQGIEDPQARQAFVLHASQRLLQLEQSGMIYQRSQVNQADDMSFKVSQEQNYLLAGANYYNFPELQKLQLDTHQDIIAYGTRKGLPEETIKQSIALNQGKLGVSAITGAIKNGASYEQILTLKRYFSQGADPASVAYMDQKIGAVANAYIAKGIVNNVINNGQSSKEQLSIINDFAKANPEMGQLIQNEFYHQLDIQAKNVQTLRQKDLDTITGLLQQGYSVADLQQKRPELFENLLPKQIESLVKGEQITSDPDTLSFVKTAPIQLLARQGYLASIKDKLAPSVYNELHNRVQKYYAGDPSENNVSSLQHQADLFTLSDALGYNGLLKKGKDLTADIATKNINIMDMFNANIRQAEERVGRTLSSGEREEVAKQTAQFINKSSNYYRPSNEKTIFNSTSQSLKEIINTDSESRIILSKAIHNLSLNNIPLTEQNLKNEFFKLLEQAKDL